METASRRFPSLPWPAGYKPPEAYALQNALTRPAAAAGHVIQLNKTAVVVAKPFRPEAESPFFKGTASGLMYQRCFATKPWLFCSIVSIPVSAPALRARSVCRRGHVCACKASSFPCSMFSRLYHTRYKSTSSNRAVTSP